MSLPDICRASGVHDPKAKSSGDHTPPGGFVISVGKSEIVGQRQHVTMIPMPPCVPRDQGSPAAAQLMAILHN